MTSEALLLKETATVHLHGFTCTTFPVQNITFKAAYQYSKILVSVAV